MDNKLVVLMLDGFRWDYYDRDKEHLNGLSKLLSEGVQVESVEPIYPVLSFPNWTTIGTGVYSDKHGISGNYMWDKALQGKDPENAIFHVMEKETTMRAHWWTDCPEPIWTTATKQGRRTFTRLWGRSDVPFQGILPEECSGYAYAPDTQEIKDTLDIGIQKLLEGFDFVMLYGEHIDNVGHTYGPESKEMKQAVRDVDDVILRFLQKLEHAQLQNVNIIVVSDHGMTHTGERSGVKYVNLEDFIDEEDVDICVDSGTYVSIAPVEGRLEIVYEKLKEMEGATVYKKENIPDSFNFKTSKFVLDLHILAKPGYFILGLQSCQKQVPHRKFTSSTNNPYLEGSHGYTPDIQDQHGIFFARGPAFKKGITHPPIKMVDIYQVFARVLGFKPLKNDGNWENVAGMFGTEDDCSH